METLYSMGSHKAYEEYKDTDVTWQGRVPNSWKPNYCFSLFKEKQIKNFGLKEKTVLTLSYGKIKIKPVDKLHGLVPASFETYQIVEEGDIIIRSTDLQNDKRSLRVGKVRSKGIITSAYLCFKPLEILDNDFAYYLLHFLDISKIIYQMGSGLRQNISWRDFRRSIFYIPGKDEQIQISKFLDYKMSQISKFIKAKKKMIELLREKKRIIINDAITGKIDVLTGKPYEKYKDSGVEWLGMVPEKWDLLPMKRTALFNPSKTETGYDNESIEQVVFLPMEKVTIDGHIDCSIKQPYKDVCLGFSYFKRGDVVVAKITPCFENGKGAFLEDLETEYGFGTTEFITIRPSKDALGSYLRAILSSKWFLKIAEKYMTGSAGQKRISSDWIKNFLIAKPANEDQKKIVSYIYSKTQSIDRIISRCEKEISLLQEYKNRLISDAVTGKIDVRNIVVPEIIDSEIVEADTDLENNIDEDDLLKEEQVEQEL